MPARRRPRSEQSRSPQQRAIAIAIKNRAKYPYATYGRAYMQRGTEDNIAMFGPTYREATDEQKAKRRALGYTGRGGYWGKRIGKWVGRRTGIPGVGSLAGLAGSKLEDYARKRLHGSGLYTGRGSYNTLMEGGDAAMTTVGSGDETESVIMTNKEFISDIYGPADGRFSNQSFDLNPGNQDCFPWLSQIAMNYEEYEFVQLVFEFRSTIDASTAADGQTGTMIMVTDYNAGHSPFKDKESMMQYHGGHSARVTENMVHGVECDPNKTPGDLHKYVRTFGVDSNEDIKSYDHGKFQLAMNNIPSIFQNNQVGELWVYYKVKLLKPKLGAGRLLNQQRDVAIFDHHSSLRPAIDFANPHADLRLCTRNNLKIKIEKYATAQLKITLPAQFTGMLEVLVNCQGTTVASPSVGSFVVSGNINPIEDLYGNNSPSSTDDAPTSTWRTSLLPGSTNNVTCAWLQHISVQSAVTGVDNVVVLPLLNLTFASVSHMSIDVREIISFSDRDDNAGMAGLPAPVP